MASDEREEAESTSEPVVKVVYDPGEAPIGLWWIEDELRGDSMRLDTADRPPVRVTLTVIGPDTIQVELGNS